MPSDIVCAMGLGFSVWLLWRKCAAKYAWVPATAWFAIGLITTMGGNNIFGRFFPFGSRGLGISEIRSFIAFTIPLIRAICYSLGAKVASRFRVGGLPSGS